MRMNSKSKKAGVPGFNKYFRNGGVTRVYVVAPFLYADFPEFFPIDDMINKTVNQTATNSLPKIEKLLILGSERGIITLRGDFL